MSSRYFGLTASLAAVLMFAGTATAGIVDFEDVIPIDVSNPVFSGANAGEHCAIMIASCEPAGTRRVASLPG